jgi:hypothetical protein
MKMTVFWAIVLMMLAVSTSETSVNFYQTTRRNIPEDSHLHELFSLRVMRRKFYGLFPETMTAFMQVECKRLQIQEPESIHTLPE